MGQYNFDKPVIRRGTNCVKWDETDIEDVIPLWVADMDFEVLPEITEALKKRVEHGVFGYAIVGESYYSSIIHWFHRRHNWKIQREWIQYTTGVVPAVSAVIKALTMPGERVLMTSPIYNCFFSCIRNNGCEVLESPLQTSIVDHQPTYVVDWEDFERKCADKKTTVFLLCNPHNPGGRVWTKEELLRMNDICLRHGVKVISDEIHCELIMPGHEFVPFASVSEACAENCVVCGSPSKSFNTAGLQMAHIICQNEEWRRRIDRAININEICDVNPFAPLAVEIAYNDGEQWIDELNDYLFGNYRFLCNFVAQELPQLKVYKLEGTYLTWIDITATGMTSDQLTRKLLREGRVWVNSGSIYSPLAGEGFIRINLATQRARLTEALQRIARTLKS